MPVWCIKCCTACFIDEFNGDENDVKSVISIHSLQELYKYASKLKSYRVMNEVSLWFLSVAAM